MEFSISDYCGVSTYVHSLLLLLQRSHCSFSPADCCTYYIGRLFSSQSQIMAWSPHLAHAITGDLLHLVNLRWSACRGGFNQAIARWQKSRKISPKSIVNFGKMLYIKRESTLKNSFWSHETCFQLKSGLPNFVYFLRNSCLNLILNINIKQVLILICLYSYIVKWKYPPGDVLWHEKLHDKARVEWTFSILFHLTGNKPLIGKLRFLQEICHRALVAVGCSMAVAAAVPTAKKLTSQQGWNWKSLVTVGILCIDRAQWLHWLNWQWGCVIGSQMAAQKHDDNLFFRNI